MVTGNLTKETIVETIRKSGPRLLSFGITSIGLFGSFARNQARPESDVDLLVEFAPDKKTFDNFIDACFLLEDLFGRKVELVTRESLSSHLSPSILREVEYVPFSN
ncbi:MAG: nucleotidyltransferase family protein [Sedimentisphaerales bacterium]|jgi:predicted nucleotidyltransferase